jgi:ribokinase
LSLARKAIIKAIGLTRLSVETTFISIIGEDENGRCCKNDLLREGVAHSHFIERKNASTSFASINRDKNGNNIVVLYPSVSDLLTPTDIDKYSDLILQSHYLLLSFEIPIMVVEHAVSIAMQNKTKVILNPAPARTLSPEVLRAVNLITPNETEAMFLLGISSYETCSPTVLARIWRQSALGSAVITLGSAGALVLTSHANTRFNKSCEYSISY